MPGVYVAVTLCFPVQKPPPQGASGMNAVSVQVAVAWLPPDGVSATAVQFPVKLPPWASENEILPVGLVATVVLVTVAVKVTKVPKKQSCGKQVATMDAELSATAVVVV